MSNNSGGKPMNAAALAAIARNARDKAFWLGLVERWKALENQKAQQPPRDKFRSPLRRQSELADVD